MELNTARQAERDIIQDLVAEIGSGLNAVLVRLWRYVDSQRTFIGHTEWLRDDTTTDARERRDRTFRNAVCFLTPGGEEWLARLRTSDLHTIDLTDGREHPYIAFPHELTSRTHEQYLEGFLVAVPRDGVALPVGIICIDYGSTTLYRPKALRTGDGPMRRRDRKWRRGCGRCQRLSVRSRQAATGPRPSPHRVFLAAVSSGV